MPQLHELMAIPLDRAWFCENCRCVVNRSTSCPMCASETSMLALATVLDGKSTACGRCKGRAFICIHCDKSLDVCQCDPTNGEQNPGSCPVCQIAAPILDEHLMRDSICIDEIPF
jgi:hypothetical protein